MSFRAGESLHMTYMSNLQQVIFKTLNIVMQLMFTVMTFPCSLTARPKHRIRFYTVGHSDEGDMETQYRDRGVRCTLQTYLFANTVQWKRNLHAGSGFGEDPRVEVQAEWWTWELGAGSAGSTDLHVYSNKMQTNKINTNTHDKNATQTTMNQDKHIWRGINKAIHYI